MTFVICCAFGAGCNKTGRRVCLRHLVICRAFGAGCNGCTLLRAANYCVICRAFGAGCNARLFRDSLHQDGREAQDYDSPGISRIFLRFSRGAARADLTGDPKQLKYRIKIFHTTQKVKSKRRKTETTDLSYLQDKSNFHERVVIT